MNERPHIAKRIAGRPHGHLTAAKAEALAVHRHATLLHRLGGRPSSTSSAAAFEVRQAVRLRHLRHMLASRG